MNNENMYVEKLFSYGTLQYENVQLATFGRKLSGTADVLVGYQLSDLKMTDQNAVSISEEEVHPILFYSGDEADQIKGVVFDISIQELQHADEYEAEEYKRVKVQLCSGLQAWVYVAANSQ